MSLTETNLHPRDYIYIHKQLVKLQEDGKEQYWPLWEKGNESGQATHSRNG